ncbi:DNA-deoxyinosine glycosylase [Chitinibacter sp. SCUT-21]|uniref:DNA-deoxyinosine glycosylase n=1 Tax=Chitinibacter sp. SCUT-21 TaxID=2970891 RepID=UPI0035A65D6F
MNNTTKECLAPIFDQGCRILILGSLPGDASLQAGHYYAHPRNAFWPIMASLLQINFCSLSFEQRYEQLRLHHIGLWDVIASAQRQGSLDSALQSINGNRLDEMISRLAKLELVIFNGKTAAKHGQKYIPSYISTSTAPSTSPAYTLSQSEKTAQWNAIFQHLSSIQPHRI